MKERVEEEDKGVERVQVANKGGGRGRWEIGEPRKEEEREEDEEEEQDERVDRVKAASKSMKNFGWEINETIVKIWRKLSGQHEEDVEKDEEEEEEENEQGEKEGMKEEEY